MMATVATATTAGAPVVAPALFPATTTALTAATAVLPTATTALAALPAASAALAPVGTALSASAAGAGALTAGVGSAMLPAAAAPIASQSSFLAGLSAGAKSGLPGFDKANPITKSAKLGAGLGAGGTALGKAGLTSALLGGGEAAPLGQPASNESPRPQSRELFGRGEDGQMQMRTLEDFIEEEFNLG